MESETIIKIIGAIVGIFGAGKIIYDITTGKKSRLREDYKFAKEFLEDLKNNPDLHPFAVEKGYHAIAGSTIVSSKEIAYILSLKNSGKCLNDYVLSRKYLQTLDTKGDLRLAFSKKYSSAWSRWLRKGIYFFLYIFCACVAIIPIFFPKYLTVLIITTLVFGYWAVIALNSYVRIYRGEQLVKHQQRHTQMILLPNRNT
ncbi:hypothetical protein [Chlorogloea sp. CCALA 695]|uniref:hypothetical protein n=1 Tax=Chlorogloea sp. CCALA 695 TaxID=2107693 RepID=UPI000D07D04C|nr:hypothetical protein [Chlorogloea sp. CCALA 695]PSB27119.1 hypothetical protein C7B70_23125 [Chlorogloea sp. CCALA 695]